MSPEPGFSQKSPLGFYSAKAAGWVCREIRTFFKNPTSGGWVSREIFGWFSCGTWLVFREILTIGINMFYDIF